MIKTNRGIITIGTKVKYKGGYPCCNRVAWVTRIYEVTKNILYRVDMRNPKTEKEDFFYVEKSKFMQKYELVGVYPTPIQLIKVNS